MYRRLGKLEAGSALIQKPQYFISSNVILLVWKIAWPVSFTIFIAFFAGGNMVHMKVVDEPTNYGSVQIWNAVISLD